ncbi:MAG: thioredoxin family protein [Methanosarcinales archaeon]|nr:thioredoxin family protein [Methanosarcinales archaeon]
MKIEVLGTGCAKCKKAKELVEKAVEETGVDAQIVKVENIDDILSYGVMVTPAIVVDGEVKIAGKIPELDTIKEWLSH